MKKIETCPRLRPRRIRLHALIDQPPGFAFDVKRELVVQIPFDAAAGNQGAKAKLQIAKAHQVYASLMMSTLDIIESWCRLSTPRLRWRNRDNRPGQAGLYGAR